MSTIVPESSSTHPTDYLEYGRPQSAAGLGLRPVTFNESAPHPDPSPCPAWCDHRPEAESHEVDVSSGGEVEHSGDSVSVRASLYQGKSGYGEAEFATLETHLETRGLARPQLHVALRDYSYPGPKHHYDEVLKLTLDDARELAAVLTYLVAQAEASA